WEEVCAGRWNWRGPPPSCSAHNLTCYGELVKGDARERIQKLLVTGDNRLKQGVDPAKARQSYEQALAEARAAGLEESIKPLVELRLADLERLSRESPPPCRAGV